MNPQIWVTIMGNTIQLTIIFTVIQNIFFNEIPTSETISGKTYFKYQTVNGTGF